MQLVLAELPSNGLQSLRGQLTFDYSKVPEKYHAAESPDTELTLYTGAVRVSHLTGILSYALGHKSLDHVLNAKRIIEDGDAGKIYELIDRYTWYCGCPPFISGTFNPQMAQVFAPDHSEKTIYRLKIQARRCVLDADDIGNTGESKELLILGAVFPEEIIAVKIHNDLVHSELLDESGMFTRMFPDKKSKSTSVKNPKNWMKL